MTWCTSARPWLSSPSRSCGQRSPSLRCSLASSPSYSPLPTLASMVAGVLRTIYNCKRISASLFFILSVKLIFLKLAVNLYYLILAVNIYYLIMVVNQSFFILCVNLNIHVCQSLPYNFGCQHFFMILSVILLFFNQAFDFYFLTFTSLSWLSTWLSSFILLFWCTEFQLFNFQHRKTNKQNLRIHSSHRKLSSRALYNCLLPFLQTQT